MERNRESRRGAGGGASAAGSSLAAASRRSRASGHKDASDDDERMDETSESRPWERSKKERLSTFQVSLSGNPRTKRKCQMAQEVHVHGRTSVCDDVDESAEETENAASEDDDEPPPPIHRRPGKFKGPGKEDEIVMDIPPVPRKARSTMSSSSRFTANLRRQQESPPADSVRQQSPLPLNGISSTSHLGKSVRKLKPPGTKFRAIKVAKIPEPAISDQEAEVAEALFVLARSAPSTAGISESRFELKSEAKVEVEPKASSPSPSIVFPYAPGNGYSSLQSNAVPPVAEAPKRKRPRVITKQEEVKASTPVQTAASPYLSSISGAMHSPVGELDQSAGCEKKQLVDDEVHDTPTTEPTNVRIPSDTVHTSHGVEEEITNPQDNQTKGPVEERVVKAEMQENVVTEDQKPVDSDTSPPNVKPIGPAADISEENEGSTCPQLLNRNSEALENDGGATKMEIDLMAPIPTEPSREDAEQPILKDPCIGLTSHPSEVPFVTADEASENQTERRDAEETGEKDMKVVERAGGFNQEQKQEIHDQISGPVSCEQLCSQTVRGSKEAEREKDKELVRTPAKIQKSEAENPSTTSFIPSTLSAGASSAPVALASWMGGLPPLGYYGPGAATWPGGGSLTGSSLDGKMAHPAMQLPHSAFLPPVPKMKRCATHVYVANFIYREQRHSLWLAARGAPYNLNFPSVIDNEKLGGAYVDATRKASAQQQSNGPGTGSTTGGSATVNSTSAASHSMVGGVSLEMGSGTASGNVMNMAAHAQYLQAMMQQNGFSFSFGPPGQAAHLMPFNGPFYPAHLMPPLPHLHSLSQQAPNMLPVQKQASSALPHSSPQLLVPPMQQQQPQPFPLPRSPSSSQQQQHQNHIGSSAQNFGGQSEKDSGESHSTADSRLSAMQRSMCGQGLSNLPNLNISPSSLMLTSSIPAMPSQHQDVSLMATLGGKPSSKSQQQVQFQSQQPSSLPPSLQQQQLLPQSTSSGSGLQMKVLDPSASQGYSSLGLAGVNRGSGPGSSSGPGPGPLGLVSVASMMASQGHGAIPGGTENARLQVHHAPPQGFGGHNQQYQRTVSKSATSVSDDTFVAGSGKGRDFVEDKKPSVKQQGGGPAFNLTRQELESSLSSVQGFPTGGGPSTAARPASNVGRTLNATAATVTGSRNSRTVSSVGTGQVPLFQGQTPKQGMGRAKAASGANFPPAATTQSVPGYAERGMPTLGKYTGTTFPFPGQMVPSSQGSKQAQSGTAKAGQRMSPGPPQQVPASAMTKSQGQQQVRSNPQAAPSVATPPRVLPSGSAPVMTSGTISAPTSNASSVAKAAVAPASKSPSNGKGSVSISKSGPGPAKKPSSVSGPTMASVMSPGQSIPLKNSGQQKGQPQLHPPITQQQANLAAQQQRLGPKIQLYAPQQTPQQPPQQQGSQYKQSAQQQSTYRPQMFLQQHQQQYMQQSSAQQQVLPQPTQAPSPHQYQQSSPTQHVQMQHHLHHDQQLPHHQQQLQSASSPLVVTTNNSPALNSPGLSLGTGNVENISSCTNSDAGDQLQGSALRGSTPKASGNRLLSGGVAENMVNAALPGHLSGVPVSAQQVGSPSGSSHYLQLAPVLGMKPAESKTLPDCTNREDINNGTRHLSSPSPSQTPLIPNPSSA